MRGNFFRCGNRVVVEGLDIGQFATMEMSEDRDTLGNTCTLTIPIYAVGYIPGITAGDRIRASLADADVRPGASIQVYTWYYDDERTGNTFNEILQFSGYITDVRQGFPTTLECQDQSFVLKFGQTNRDWRSRTSLETMLNYLLPIANDAFEQFRTDKQFARPSEFTKLTFDSTESADIEFALQLIKTVSPYEALNKLLKLFTLYCNVSNEGAVYFGLGIRDKFEKTVELATNTNVIERNITTTNGLFENYKVIVNGLIGGRRYTFEYGDSEAQAEKLFSPLNTIPGIQQYARSVMEKLRGNKNTGTLVTVLYPECRLYDIVDYTDTVFPEFSGRYYVIGRQFTAGPNGYRQILTVTDQSFIL